ncbi:TraR/DksA C4-type zinc finger protein [Shewanella insulae]|uniref:TraR/DksA family transcriptional regulator n=1 Tax=Shewanella insulae TaxID=2681496 RepID=UPI001EFC8AA7|nr:TraR/DksA C4-type zinc finger protein [Shewanella insulae]MCG9755019.1 TraR/DksA C4-type zinc finger protein [Shewanella insulae]
MFDRASDLEQCFRDDAIANARQVATEVPDEVDGVRYCLGCGCDISKQRLEARPNAVRCASCQTLKERNGGRRG